MNSLDEVGEVLRSIPGAEELEQEHFENSFEVLMVSDAEEAAIKEAVMNVSEVENAVVDILDPDAKPAAAAPAPAASAPAPAAAAPAAPAAPANAPAAPKPSAPANKPAAAKPAAPAAGGGDKKKSHASQSVRVDIDKLDILFDTDFVNNKFAH